MIVPNYRELAKELETRRKGKRVALTNGCFDVIHVGHVRLIREAATLADLLVLALNDDASARENKGDGRPFVPLFERMEIVDALSGVDFVTSFGEPTAAPMLDSIRPDLHVKGTDWTAETVPERDVVLAYGGNVVIAGDPKLHSSTALIERLQERSSGRSR